MTVAAIVIVPETRPALADADGEPAVRRVLQTAWSGGALPIVVVCQDPDGIAAALVELPVTVARPPDDEPRGIAWFARGLAAASGAVSETTAGLLWPFRFAWVDPETITSLVEAHGATPEAIVRPAFDGQPGFPILVPTRLYERLAATPDLHGEEALLALVEEGVPYRTIELGDPGALHDLATARADLPPYLGPPEPAGGQAPEWNEALGARAEAQAALEVEAADALEARSGPGA